MIHYLTHNEIDKSKWDECIGKSLNSIIYACSWYLDLMAEDWDALVEDDYRAVFPLTFNIKHGIKYLYQPPFCQQLGIFSSELVKPEKIREFIEKIPATFKLIEISLNKYNHLANYPGARLRPMANYELDLISGFGQIQKGYSQSHRRNIEKANKADLFLQKNLQPEVVIDLFRNNTGKEKGFYSENHYKKLQRLIYELIHKGRAEVWAVRNRKNQVLSAAFFLIENNRIIFLFSGRDKQTEQQGAMHMLINECIKAFAGKAVVFDFEGSNDVGTARFYAGFGAKEYKYIHLQINKLAWPLKQLLPFLKRIVKNL